MAFKPVHGMTKTPEHRSWREMLSRCYNQNNDRYSRYGGRGIMVCERWRYSFVNFFADMGKRPAWKTLDRRDNDGDYTPDNCRWATREEQQQNTRQTKYWKIHGVVYIGLGEAARKLGVPRPTLQWRFTRRVPGYECVARMQQAKRSAL